jgi:hypothetical protein
VVTPTRTDFVEQNNFSGNFIQGEKVFAQASKKEEKNTCMNQSENINAHEKFFI